MSNVKRIARNSIYQAAAYGIKAIANFVVYILLGRLAGAETLGSFAMILTLNGFFAFIAAFGLPELLTREIARQREETAVISRLINISVTLVLLLSIIAAILMLCFGMIANYSSTLLYAIILAALALGLESVINVLSAAFRGTEDMVWSSLFVIIMEFVFLVLATFLIFLNSNLVILLALFGISRLISLIVSAKIYASHFQPLRLTFNYSQSMNLLKRSFPFAANNGLSLVYVRLDILILSFLTNHAAVGLYEAATSLAVRVNVLARTINLSLYPFLSKKHTDDAKAVTQYTAVTIHYLVIPGFLISLIFATYSEKLITLLYGTHFQEAAPALYFLSFIIPLRFIDNSLAIYLTSTNRQNLRTIAIAGAAILNITLNIILIPIIGFMGAVIATIATEICLFILFVWFLRDEINQLLQIRSFTAPITATILVTILANLQGTSFLIVNIMFASALYSILILILDKVIRHALQTAFQKLAIKLETIS